MASGNFQKQNVRDSYLSACAYKNGFLLAGDGGRLDFVNASGEMTSINTGTDRTLHAVCKCSDGAVAAGACGTLIFVGENGAVPINTGITSDLICACEFRGVVIVGGADGKIFAVTRGGDVKEVYSGTGSVTGVASNDERCIGVTSDGKAVISENADDWTEFPYSEYYGAAAEFDGITSVDAGFFAYGREDGRTFTVTTQLGGVWTKRDLNVYGSGRTVDVGEASITCAVSCGMQIVAALSDGRALVMPECPKCNILRNISNHKIYAAAVNGESVIFAGEEYFYKTVDFDILRQQKIRLEKALEMADAGAVIIDVRDEYEYAVSRIEKSINIPLYTLEDALHDYFPDKTSPIIFCCRSGAKSRAACSISKAMGYTEIYDLGGIAEITENGGNRK